MKSSDKLKICAWIFAQCKGLEQRCYTDFMKERIKELRKCARELQTEALMQLLEEVKGNNHGQMIKKGDNEL